MEAQRLFSTALSFSSHSFELVLQDFLPFSISHSFILLYFFIYYFLGVVKMKKFILLLSSCSILSSYVLADRSIEELLELAYKRTPL